MLSPLCFGLYGNSRSCAHAPRTLTYLVLSRADIARERLAVVSDTAVLEVGRACALPENERESLAARAGKKLEVKRNNRTFRGRTAAFRCTARTLCLNYAEDNKTAQTSTPHNAAHTLRRTRVALDTTSESELSRAAAIARMSFDSFFTFGKLQITFSGTQPESSSPTTRSTLSVGCERSALAHRRLGGLSVYTRLTPSLEHA